MRCRSITKKRQSFSFYSGETSNQITSRFLRHKFFDEDSFTGTSVELLKCFLSTETKISHCFNSEQMTAEISEERGILKSQPMKAEDKALTVKCGILIYSEDASRGQTG